MKKISILLFFLTLILLGFFNPFAKAKTEDVPPPMYGFLTRVLNLQPYLYSKDAFVADQNQKVVAEELSKFSELADQLKKHERLRTPGFTVPANVIVKQLRDVKDMYDNGHRAYAWSLLRSTLHSCSQCHTQVAKGTKQPPLWNFEGQNLPNDPMELGDFWFMIRGYDKAFEQFSKVVHRYGKKEYKDSFELRRALRYVLTITLRIDQSPQKALDFLNQLNNTSSFPKDLRDSIGLWKNELTMLKSLPAITIDSIPVQKFEDYIEELFRAVYPIPRENRSKDVALEFGSGLLFEFVNSRPKEATQRMYYWLGVSTIELNRFDSSEFGDPYLKLCIEKFPTTLISYECYSSLRDEWVFEYSGSAGISLPKYNKEELQRLKKILQSPGL